MIRQAQNLGGKQRKDDLPSFHQDDIPMVIGILMGGREFFSDIEARNLHRIGLFKGLGWTLGFGGAKDGIDHVRVTVMPPRRDEEPHFAIDFGRNVPVAEYCSPEVENIRRVDRIPPAQLRAVYDLHTIGEATSA